MITAVDVGGTKTLVAQFSDKGILGPQNRFPTPASTQELVNLIQKNLQSEPAPSVMVVGIPGQISEDGSTILWCGHLPWRNEPLQKMLKQVFNCPVYLKNDVALAGLGEINALSPIPKLGAYLTVSTGVNAAFIAQGQLVPGFDHTEAGNIMLQEKGKWQKWEELASGKAINQHFKKMAQDLTDPGEWEWVADQLSIGLVALIPIIQPDVLVFGGGVGQFFDKFKEALSAKLKERLSPNISMPKMQAASHPLESVLYGCYHYALNQRRQ